MTARNFKFGEIRLPDIDPSLSADEIRKMYATQYPALTNAVIVYPEHDGGKDYAFQEKPAQGKGDADQGGKSQGGKSQTVEFKPSVGRKG